MNNTGQNSFDKSKYSLLPGTVILAFLFATSCQVLAQDQVTEEFNNDEVEIAPAPNALGTEYSPEVEIMSNGNIVITPTIDSHAGRIADSELIQSVQQNPDSVIGKTLQFGSGEKIGTILDVQRKIDDLFLYIVVDATDFFNADATYAVAVRDLWEVKDEVVLMPMVKGMHLKGITYYPEEFVAYDENFYDPRVDEIFDEATEENTEETNE